MKIRKLLVALLLVSIITFQKNDSVYAINENEVYLGGQVVGVAIYTDGLYVSEVTEITNSQGKTTSPAKNAGIKTGDRLISANGVTLLDVSNLDAVLSASHAECIEIEYIRNGKTCKTTVKPEKCKDGYCLGLWIRDSVAGLGTVTYIDKDGNFYALGHPITDSATGCTLPIRVGKILKCNVFGIKKQNNDSAGELQGSFGTNAEILGNIENNGKFGLLGEINGNFKTTAVLPIGNMSEVHTGKASIYSNFDGEIMHEYEIEIQHVFMQNTANEKNMVIKIIDKELLEKTGGIVQGMSGSPIVQDGKLIGAVTHVMLSDSSKGYGVFIENMSNVKIENDVA